MQERPAWSRKRSWLISFPWRISDRVDPFILAVANLSRSTVDASILLPYSPIATCSTVHLDSSFLSRHSLSVDREGDAAKERCKCFT